MPVIETEAHCGMELITAVKSFAVKHPVYIKNTRILGYLLRNVICYIFV
jgi:hypothetical protein